MISPPVVVGVPSGWLLLLCLCFCSDHVEVITLEVHSVKVFKCYPHCVRCSRENFLYSLCAEFVLTGMQGFTGGIDEPWFTERASGAVGGG